MEMTSEVTIKQFDYVVVSFGYTERVNIAELKKAMDDPLYWGYELVFISYHMRVDPFKKPDTAYITSIFNMCDCNETGAIAFKKKGMYFGDAMRIADLLIKFKYCGNFRHDTIVEVKQCEDVVYIRYDTESG